ncbi:MAG: bifunctional adenosylcobinamide kinase/adenosylcobinamide-phosphate guanylyltransferase [Syntrophus sp. (in: bacteria)]|nr:bifunctional adenosylcobinamide kinase/adenosylcobinamide-phosphate guanylyltransferase [Syntrophus sp. (in: bacteria)]
MAKIIFITGGSRSGKSGYGQSLAESRVCKRTYIATCPIVDEEMAARIHKHRQQREASDWQTLEETIDLAGALRGTRESAVRLIDCLTLWINNLLYEAQKQDRDVTEDDIARLCADVLTVCAALPGDVIFIANEVGMGVVPDNPLSRRFRDLSGRCNQIMAAGADRVILMVCGLPLEIKYRQL